MKQLDILLVEDDQDLQSAMQDALEQAGYSVAVAVDGVAAVQCLEEHSVRIVISDVHMKPVDGMVLLKQLKQRFPELPVLLMTGYASVDQAVLAMRQGAVDYLAKPFDLQTLLDKVGQSMAPEAKASGVVASDDTGMQGIVALAGRVAKSDLTVLIQGESGTGKEVLARFIHRNSHRNNGPFIAINCAAIPENMLEAMLFGYEKGAFTGAHQSTSGKFEQAQQGTLLLDEISEMDIGLQAKLLRVLQEKEVERLGGRKPIALDVRVLATTNRNLRESVSKGEFREDLLYRLNVFPLTIPPLRQRPSDIVPLARTLLARHWQGGVELPALTQSAEQRLMAYPWPGNVRELENVIQRALILMNDATLSDEHLIMETQIESMPMEMRVSVPENDQSLMDGMRTVEDKLILKTLQEAKGSRKTTADRLGISPRTLRYKIARMKEAGIAIPA